MTDHRHTYRYSHWLEQWPGITRDGLVSTATGGGNVVVICGGCGNVRIVTVVPEKGGTPERSSGDDD